MQLLNTADYSLREFNGTDIEPYAILSHCWGTEEVTYRQLEAKTYDRESAGWLKVERCCRQAALDGMHWAWVDTCCIDKSSSAELSETINSMFAWYKHAKVCYVFLADFHAAQLPDVVDFDREERWKQGLDDTVLDAVASFANSRWFTRGWTLQELLAPHTIHFYSSRWQQIGSKETLALILSAVTRIDVQYLDHSLDLRDACIAQRMSWASRRTTTRPEDMAYSLLGLFDVNMPLLYGEGSKAFLRLQLEILKQTTDESLFAWRTPDDFQGPTGILASEPRRFEGMGCVRRSRSYELSKKLPWTVTNQGLEISVPSTIPYYGHNIMLPLNCEFFSGVLRERPTHYLILVLMPTKDRRFLRGGISVHEYGRIGRIGIAVILLMTGSERIIVDLDDRLQDISRIPERHRGEEFTLVDHELLGIYIRCLRLMLFVIVLLVCQFTEETIESRSPLLFWVVAMFLWRLGCSSSTDAVLYLVMYFGLRFLASRLTSRS